LTLEQKAAHLDDPGAKLIDSLTSIWNRFGIAAIITLVVIVVVAGGAFLVQRSRAADEQDAAGKLAEANVYFWRGAYDRSLQAAREVSGQWPGAPSGVDALRLAGDSYFWMGNYKEAAAQYEQYLAKRKSGLLTDAVRRSLAYTLETNQQPKEAAAAYEGLVGKFDRESSAEFLYAAARCYLQLKQPGEADLRLKRLVDEYGETTYALRARIQRAELAAAQN
jgi:predicted negative regulator of RcsB-dependent stress response